MDVGFQLLQELREKGVQLISDWIDNAYREDLHLDFKRKANPSSPRLTDEDKRNLSRALSGFANSDSGVIIWGIGAASSGQSHRTRHPIRKVRAFAEHLDSMLSRLVSPFIDGVINEVIFENAERDTGYVVTYVPRSDKAPHRAENEGLKQYYKRYGDSFKIAEHYELEYMFGKRLTPHLHVFWDATLKLPPTGSGSEDLYDGEVKIGLTNQGRAIAQFACLRLRYDSTSRYLLERDSDADLIHYSAPQSASKPNYHKVTARALPGLVIYPDDHSHFFTFHIHVTREEVLQGSLPNLVLYYDLFAQDIVSQSGTALNISGRKIGDAFRKKIDMREVPRSA